MRPETLLLANTITGFITHRSLPGLFDARGPLFPGQPVGLEDFLDFFRSGLG
jgi:hypothetical protein